jgi:photosystem II stability/assembly factor-like uncharacterized protein
LVFSTAGPGSQRYRWKSVTIGAQGNGSEEVVSDLVSPREGAHLISGFRGLGGFTHWDLNRTATRMTTSSKLEDIESLSWAVDCSLLVVRAGKGPSKNGDYTYDGGATWNEFATEPAGAQGGSIVFNSTAQVIVWSTGGSTWRSFDFGKTWGKCQGLSGNMNLVADGVTPTRTYALSGSKLYSSDDTASSFQPVDSVGLPTDHERMRATEYQVGDLWLPSQLGLFHSVDAGKFFQKLPHIDSVESVGFGKPALGKVYPTLFMNGRIDDTVGVYRSDDEGQTWTRISDSSNGFGVHGIVTGDPRIYGRVYLGTKGHGILYGDPD